MVSRRLRNLFGVSGGVAILSVLVVLILGAAPGCSKSGSQADDDDRVGTEAADSGAGRSAPALKKEYDFDVPLVEYKWDPQAGDPSVSAEDGGPGFTGEGWESNMKFLALGSADAVKGGTLTNWMLDWPATLRSVGKDSNTSTNYSIRDMCYQTLLDLHPNTLEYIPELATHWWISEDKSTYRFRINPVARWSNGEPVTADDVVASYKLRMDPTLLYPMGTLVFGKFEVPVAKSKYIVEVKAKEENWRNFLYFSAAMHVFPAAEVSIPGSEYLDKYQFGYTVGSGAYIVKPENIVTNQSVSVLRRKDWWDAGNPAWQGYYNIDRLKLIVVKDPNLAFEKLKKGEIDFFYVNRPQWWIEDLEKVDAVQRGLLVKRKFFNDSPSGTRGLAIQMSKPPLDDVRMRKALCQLLDRKTLIEKIYYNDRRPLNSYYQGAIYQNPNNVMTAYDPFRAVELLEEMGWTEKNSANYRVKGGKELKLSISYANPLSEQYLTVYQEECKQAGIRIELQRLTPASAWKNVTEKEFELAVMGWSGLIFPNPETSLHSSLADKKSNNNISSFKSERVDELLVAYDREYDLDRRIEIIREIDGIVFNAHPFVLSWYEPWEPLAFWNKFGMPEWGGQRTLMYDEFIHCWWVDPEKEKNLEDAKKDKSITMPKGELENHYWEAWNVAQKAGSTSDSLGN